MKTTVRSIIDKIGLILIGLLFSTSVSAQGGRSGFWGDVQYGGGFGLGISRDYTNVLVAPSAIYPLNDYFSTGVGLMGSFVKSKNNIAESFSSKILGGSLIGLVNPLENVQLSAELEQMHVQQQITSNTMQLKDDFWNTALFLGIGFRSENLTIGLRYNVLFDEKDRIYADPYMPFVRLYF
jgi:long-subunit fatty acid transport protein